MRRQQPDADSLPRPGPSSVPRERSLPCGSERHSLPLQNRDQSLFLQGQLPIRIRNGRKGHSSDKSALPSPAQGPSRLGRCHGPGGLRATPPVGTCPGRGEQCRRAELGAAPGSAWSLSGHVFLFRRTTTKKGKGLPQKSPKSAHKVHVWENSG